MQCNFCYCPFVGGQLDQDLCLKIISKCRELGAKIITFGGGDPLLAADPWQLFHHAKTLGLFVHVDTNGLRLHETDYSRLKENVDLLGLPLDGGTETTHALVRSHRSHFGIVHRHLAKISCESIKIKINTLVSRLNVEELPLIAESLRNYNVSLWSLYQYWHIDGLSGSSDRHSLTDKDFNDAILGLKDASPSMEIEPGPVAERAGTYFFVTHQGKVYTSSPKHPDGYDFLGSIFEDTTIELWQSTMPTSIRQRARCRYQGILGT